METIPLIALPLGRVNKLPFGAAKVDPSASQEESEELEVVTAKKLTDEDKPQEGKTAESGAFGGNTTLVIGSALVSLFFILTAVAVTLFLGPKAPSPPSPPPPPSHPSPLHPPSPLSPPPPSPAAPPPYPYGLNVSAVLSGDVSSFNMQAYDANITTITDAHSVQSVVLSGSISVNSFLGYYAIDNAQSAYAVLTTSSYASLGSRLGYTVESIHVTAYGFDPPVVSTCPSWPPSSKTTTCSLVGGCGGAMLGGYKITTNSVLSTPKRVVCNLPSY